jgi:hypothetical protein
MPIVGKSKYNSDDILLDTQGEHLTFAMSINT